MKKFHISHVINLKTDPRSRKTIRASILKKKQSHHPNNMEGKKQSDFSTRRHRIKMTLRSTYGEMQGMYKIIRYQVLQYQECVVTLWHPMVSM